jgi:hypothetical protein
MVYRPRNELEISMCQEVYQITRSFNALSFFLLINLQLLEKEKVKACAVCKQLVF